MVTAASPGLSGEPHTLPWARLFLFPSKAQPPFSLEMMLKQTSLSFILKPQPALPLESQSMCVM